MSPEILDEARIVRESRTEVPMNLPESIDLAILQESIRTIEVFLEHYREGNDGSSFRYVKRSQIKNVTKAKLDRQQIVKDAADQLEWILSNDKPQGIGITFRDICDAQNVKDIEMFRKDLLGILFGDVHENAKRTLLNYLEWKGKSENADSYSIRTNYSPSRRLQTQS